MTLLAKMMLYTRLTDMKKSSWYSAKKKQFYKNALMVYDFVLCTYIVYINICICAYMFVSIYMYTQSKSVYIPKENNWMVDLENFFISSFG